MNEFAELKLYDTDLVTMHGILPFRKADLYLQLNEPGSGSVETALDISSAALVESGGFVDVHYRGGMRGGFFVENITASEANAQEEEGRLLSVSGRGALVLLEDAIVWDDGSGATTRTLSGTKAGMIIQLIEEAQLRGALLNLSCDFTDTVDSDGVSWTDDTPLNLTVGTSLLDVVRKIAKGGIDFDILPDGTGQFVLSAYLGRLGSDKSGTVFFRVGVNCQEVQSEEAGGDIRNVLRIKYKGGFVTASDPTSIIARRRREKSISLEYAQSSASALSLGGAELQTKKDPRKQISVEIYDGKGPRIFEDYVLGDTITLDKKGVQESYRIRGMHASWNGEEFAGVIVDLNSMILENEIRLTQDVDWLTNEMNSAHDANLLEVRYWAAFGDPNVAITVKDMLIVGSKVFVLNSGGDLYIYDINAGGWSRVDLSYSPQCMTAVGATIYIGCFDALLKYDSLTDTVSTVLSVDVSTSISPIEAVDSMVYFQGSFSGSFKVIELDSSDDTYTDITDPSDAGQFVSAFTNDGSVLYAVFSTSGGVLKSWNGATWATLGAFTETVKTLAMYGTSVLAGTSTGSYLYIWNGVAWAVFAGGMSGQVNAIAVYLTDVYVGGNFTTEGNYIAVYRGGEWQSLAEGLDNNVSQIHIYNEDVYVAGVFTEAGDKPAYHLAVYFNNFESLADYLENSSSSFNLAEAIHAATAKTAMTGADEFGMWDSLSKRLRKITWSNILTSIKTYTDGLYVALTGAQTIAGVKTFSSFPVTPSSAPTTDYQVANKKYVDDNAGGGGGSPGGADTQIQYNNAGAFGGSDEFAIDVSGKVLYVGETATSGIPSHGFNFNPTGRAGHTLHTWGTAISSYIRGVLARGTKASPTAVQSGDVFMEYRGAGYDGVTAVGSSSTAAKMAIVASENHDATHHGTDVEIYATPTASTILTKILSILGSGHLDIASGKEYRVNGAQHTHPHAHTQVILLGTALEDGTIAAGASATGKPFRSGVAAGGFNVAIPIAGTLKNLYFRTGSTQPATGSLTCTLNVNNSQKSIVATCPAGATANTFSDTTHTYALSAGDVVWFDLKNNATGTSAQMVSIVIVLEFDTGSAL